MELAKVYFPLEQFLLPSDILWSSLPTVSNHEGSYNGKKLKNGTQISHIPRNKKEASFFSVITHLSKRWSTITKGRECREAWNT